MKLSNKTPTNKQCYEEWLRRAKIFNFDTCVSYDLGSVGDGIPEASLEAFYRNELDQTRLGLPFKVTTVVTPDCALLLMDLLTDDPNKPEHVGGGLLYLLLVNVRINDSSFKAISFGVTGWNKVADSSADVNAIAFATYIARGKGWINLDGPDLKRHSGLFAPYIGKAMTLIMSLNTPDRFILETAPVNTGVRSKNYIPRSHQRPEYILLHPGVIRQYMKTEHEIMGKTRCGHERRAHNRTYPDDPIKFPKAHGKTVRIDAMWIGTTEAVVGDRRYKVILDV
jgi:hypothetical protein